MTLWETWDRASVGNVLEVDKASQTISVCQNVVQEL